MQARITTPSLDSLLDNMRYFANQAKLRATANQEQVKAELKQFSQGLNQLYFYTKREYQQAVANNDMATQNYIINFSKKMENLKNVAAAAGDSGEYNQALLEVMNAAYTPLTTNEKIACVVIAITCAILGAAVGVSVGFIAGLLTSAVFLVMTLPVSIALAECVPVYVALNTALFMIVGTIASAIMFGRIGHKMAEKSMKENHSTYIENATDVFVKTHQSHEQHYQSPLFFRDLAESKKDAVIVEPRTLVKNDR